LNDIITDAVPRTHQPDQLDIEVGLRSQRQCEEELGEGCYRDHFALQLQALTIDDGGMEDAAIRHPGQVAATIAGGRPRFATDGYTGDMALCDLVAVNAISARRIGVARRSAVEIWRASRVGVIDLPIGIEVPVSFAHAADGPRSIKREPRDVVRRTSDRPIGTSSSSARIHMVSFATIRRWAVIAVVIPSAHRPFVDVEAHIEALAHGLHEARPQINSPL